MDPIGHDLERHDLESVVDIVGCFLWLLFVVAFLLLIIVGGLWLRWKSGKLRRFALQRLGQLDAALRARNYGDLLKLLSHFRPNPAAPLGKNG